MSRQAPGRQKAPLKTPQFHRAAVPLPPSLPGMAAPVAEPPLRCLTSLPPAQQAAAVDLAPDAAQLPGPQGAAATADQQGPRQILHRDARVRTGQCPAVATRLQQRRRQGKGQPHLITTGGGEEQRRRSRCSPGHRLSRQAPTRPPLWRLGRRGAAHPVRQHGWSRSLHRLLCCARTVRQRPGRHSRQQQQEAIHQGSRRHGGPVPPTAPQRATTPPTATCTFHQPTAAALVPAQRRPRAAPYS